jgi:hypothetical protein
MGIRVLLLCTALLKPLRADSRALVAEILGANPRGEDCSTLT